MRTSVDSQMNIVLRQKNRRRQWLTVLAGLALGVALGTALSLRMTGQAQTYTMRVLDCAYEVHMHNASCYNENGELICGIADFVLHTHNADCYDRDGNLVCPLPEIRAHEHTAACYATDGSLVCSIREAIPHIHTAECYDAEGKRICPYLEVREQVHDETCMKEVELTPDEVVLMQIEESRAASEAASIEAEEAASRAAELEGAEAPEGEEANPSETEAADENEDNEQTDDDAAPDEDDEAENGEDADELNEENPEDADSDEEDDAYDSEASYELIEKIWSDHTLTVKATYTKAAGIPDEAELRVYLVTPDNTPKYYDELLTEASEEDTVIGMGFFLDGKEIKPKDDVVYTIIILDENGNPSESTVTVLRVAENGSLEKVEDTDLDANGKTSFTAEGVEQDTEEAEP